MDGVSLYDLLLSMFSQVLLEVAHFAVCEMLSVYGDIPPVWVYLVVVVDLADRAHLQGVFGRLKGVSQSTCFVVEWYSDLVYGVDFVVRFAACPYRSWLSDHA